MNKTLVSIFTLVVFCGMFISCSVKSSDQEIENALYVPKGFIAKVFVDSITETVRHLTVSENNTVYAKFKKTSDAGSMAAIADRDGDGRSDELVKFANDSMIKGYGYSTGARIYNEYLYFSTELAVYRYKLNDSTFVPEGPIETVLVDDHEHGMHEHIGKPIAFDENGYMYVPFGAPNNACQEPKRTPFQPGQDPCPLLGDHAGIWRFDANKLNQTQKDGEQFATGLRSIVGLDWNSADKKLYAVVHGRDDLMRLWPDRYDGWQSAVLPSEEFLRIEKGDNFGWPYCYYDQIKGMRVDSPEYGGDGSTTSRCGDFKNPIFGFPGHWAPNDLVFYHGDAFPERYKNGAFIAFHGSTNRAPYPQSGYFIGFVPFENGEPTGEYEVFADGFAEVDPIVNVRDAVYRPMGIAFGPDGTMYIGDTEKGRIWSIKFTGDKNNFGKDELAEMEERKKLSHIRTPDPIEDNLTKDLDLTLGGKIYTTYCVACHQINGKGASGRFPPLNKTDWVLGDKKRLISLIINGLEGQIEVNGETYNGIMPQHSFLSDEEIAGVLTYIRSNFGNNASAVTTEEVKAIRTKQTN